MDRKEFMKTATAAALLGSLGGLTACASHRVVTGQRDGNRLQISRETFGDEPFLLVDHPSNSAPIFLLHDAEEDAFSAVLLECTHRQCTVDPGTESLDCPCHGSRYDTQGKVLEGPADRDLNRYTVDSDEENIYIFLD